MDELTLAFRRVRHHPAATVASIVTLACSIGAAAATWSLLSAVLLRPLPVRDPAGLVVVGELRDVRGLSPIAESHDYRWFRQVREAGIFEQVAGGGSAAGPLLVDAGGALARTPVYFASHDWFDLLGVQIPIGRAFSAADDRRGAAPVAVISNAYWRRLFQADPQVVGRTITVAAATVTIVGIAPAGFRGISLASAPDLYLPLHTVEDVVPTGNYLQDGSRPNYSPTSWITIAARLRPGSTASGVAAQLAGLMTAVAGRQPPRSTLLPIQSAALPAAGREGIAHFSRLLSTTVALLLLVGCTTVGMLLLVRSEARREEIATCLALGASRGRLVRGIALEGLVLAAAGALLAIPVTSLLFAAVQSSQLPGSVSLGRLSLGLDAPVVFACGVGALAATLLVSGLASLSVMSGNIAEALRGRAAVTPRVARRGPRTLVVTTQIAVALVLLAGAGLFARSLSKVLQLNPGFATHQLVTGIIPLSQYGYTPARSAEFGAELTARLAANPLIGSVALTAFQGGMGPFGRLLIDGQPRQFPSMVDYNAIDSRYFATIGLRLIAGRDFADTDNATAPRVIIVSESFGRMIANGGNPLGMRIRASSWRPPALPAEQVIVGIVPDVITSVAVDQPLVIYRPMLQADPVSSVDVIARAAGSAEAAAREIAATIRQLDSRLTPPPMVTLQEGLARQMEPQRFGVRVLGALSLIALLLAALGTYVLAETMAVTRTREMGIRAALGARRIDLATLVLLESARLVGIGLVVGMIVAWLGAGTIRSFLFKVQPLDAATLGGVAAVIAGIALVVSVRPAVRAARVDVSAMLRDS